MKISDPGTIPKKIMKSGAMPEKVGYGIVPEGKIRVSTGKGRIRASTRNGGSRRVPEMWDLGEYQKCGIWASTGKITSG